MSLRSDSRREPHRDPKLDLQMAQQYLIEIKNRQIRINEYISQMNSYREDIIINISADQTARHNFYEVQKNFALIRETYNLMADLFHKIYAIYQESDTNTVEIIKIAECTVDILENVYVTVGRTLNETAKWIRENNHIYAYICINTIICSKIMANGQGDLDVLCH